MSEFNRLEVHWYSLVLLRTTRFEGVMDRLGKRRIAGPSGWALLYLMPVAAAVGFFIFLRPIELLFSPSAPAFVSYVRTLSPLGNIGIPGLNPYIPIVDGWIALIIAMIVHEGAHGVIARSLGLPVKASGLIFILFVIPIGAFVDVDEDALKVAKSSHAGRVLAAGAGVNLVLAVVCLLLLFSAVGNLRPKVDGIAVGSINPGYPAAQAGIRPGDFITAVNGIPIDSSAAVNGSSWYRIGQSVNITVWRDGEYLQFNQVVIGSYPVNDTRTGIVSQRPIIGFGGVDYSTLTGMVSTYSGSFFSRALYFDIPTLPIAQGVVPFGDSTAAFYTSSIGSSLVPLLDLLYWIFFLNFNLAIFNSLPLYPLDGGQAFMVGLKALGGGKLSEESLGRLTTAASLIVLGIILLVVAGPYLI